eukprot:TRINITY_DN14594_c0_g1_i1.p1 TRINITY_DN14594_c0_g1~~TRINITY_DN14594_c0_g1_i1.p1  ORF type:complete len:319 (+),score=34.95 TRINITY_DN14594_c0_g1_i1:34-990(+)
MSGSTSPPHSKPLWIQFLQSTFFTAAVGTALTSVVSTPAEVIKTRLQLQGELMSSSNAQRIYKGPFHGLWVIAKTEGVRGVWKGLVPGIWYQIAMNGTRLTFHHHIKDIVGAHPENRFFFFRNILAAGTAGILGAMIGSPLYLVKVRLQSACSVASVAVGHQHHYTGMIEAIQSIFKKEGVRGLWRGVEGQMLRVGVGSSVQLSSYDQIKHFIGSFEFFQRYPGLLPMVSAFITSFPVAVAMNPVDCVATRLYNQPVVNGKGTLYTGPFNCLRRTLQEEGMKGLYKGTFANYVRLGPHTVCTFVFWEQTKKLVALLDE